MSTRSEDKMSPEQIKTLEDRAKAAGISRRDFVLMLASGAAGALLAARPGGAISATNPSPVKPEGTVTIALPSFGREEWLGASAAISEREPMAGVWETLLDRDRKTNAPSPLLAEKFQMTPTADGVDWLFDLRKGVKWSDDWGEFTAEDVKFSYELMISKSATNFRSAAWRSMIKSVEIVNPHRIIFHTNKSGWHLPYDLTPVLTNFPISCKKYVGSVGHGKAVRQAPIGTGPYRVVKYEPAVTIQFEAVENHWRKTPYVKTIIMRMVPEEATRVAMLRAGEIDIAPISFSSIAELKNTKGIQVRGFPETTNLVLLMTGDWPGVESVKATYDPTVPWGLPDEPRATKVRKALRLAINVPEILGTILRGYGKENMAVANFWPEMPSANPAWKIPPYDPKEAKTLLAEAGYPNGFDLTMTLMAQAGSPFVTEVGEAIAMYWEKNLGLRVRREPMEDAKVKELWRKATPGLIMAYCSPYYDEPIVVYSSHVHTRSQMYMYSRRPFLNKMIEEAESAIDFKTRQMLIRKIGDWFYDNYVPPIVLASMDSVYGLSARIGDWSVYPHYRFVHAVEYLKLK